MPDQLRDNSNLLLEILNDLSGMYYRCLLDKDFTMIYVSKGCKSLTGYEARELLNNEVISYGSLVHPADYEDVFLKFSENIREKQTGVYEYRIRDKYGRIRQVWEKAAGVYDQEGNLLYIEGYITEPTQFREKEEIHNELLLYKQAIDFNTLCSITDRAGKLVYVNEKFCQVSGYTEKELLGANHRIVNSGYHDPVFFQDMWETISSGQVWHGELRNKTKNGAFYWVDTVIMPILHRQKRIIQYFSIGLPITGKKEAEEKNRQHIKALEKMLFMISHELRQPVTTALGLMSLVEMGDAIEAGEQEIIMQELKAKVLEIDKFTRKLTDYIHEHKILRE